MARLLAEELGFPAESLAHISSRIAHRDQHPDLCVLVAEADGAVVGVATFIICHLLEYELPQARLSAIAVDSSFRQAGVGRSLVADVERRAAAAGCFRVELTSSHDLTDAHEFWARLGYENSGVRFKRTL